MKIRKSVKYTCIIISIVLFIFSCVNIIGSLAFRNSFSQNKEIYSYKNGFNYDYTVNLKENRYMSSDDISKETYVTDLIDNIDLNLNYNYEGSSESDITYTYKVVGQLNGVYTRNGEENNIWEKQYVLKDETTNTIKSNKIDINANLKLDLTEQNNLVKDFETEMEMSLDANFIVALIVETNTVVEGESISNKYTKSVTINLAEKITKLTGDNNLEEKEFISKEYETQDNINVPYLVVNVVILIISVFLFKSVIKREPINIIKNEYRQELNRILRLCQDKIVQASINPIIDKENIIDVKDFSEIIKLSEELFKPILYWFSEENEEAEFSVISDNLVYRYILKK